MIHEDEHEDEDEDEDEKNQIRSNWPLRRPAAGLNPEPLNPEPLNVYLPQFKLNIRQPQ
jgi:hypothetical protein